MANMKFGWKSFKAPTPKVMKRAAGAALALGTTLSAFTLNAAVNTEDVKAQNFLWTLTYVGLALTAVGTVLPFFAEDTDVQQ